jgi:hypothetical protein
MRAFEFKRGTEVWPQGETLLHVYALPDLEHDWELADLIHGCRAAVADYPLTDVADEWLHVTISQITDAVGGAISQGERELLAEELQKALREVDPFTITVGSCLTYHSGPIFDLHPDHQLKQLHDVVESVVERLRGPEAIKYDTGVLHLTLAYASGDADSDEMQRALRRVRPSHAPMTIRSVHLLEVAAHPDAKTIIWTEPIAEIPLGRGVG